MDHGCVTILSSDKVTRLEMLNSPHALACLPLWVDPISSSRSHHSAKVWAWVLGNVPSANPLLASQTKGVLLGPLPGRDDLFTSPPCSHHDVQGIEVSSSGLECVCVCVCAHVCTCVVACLDMGPVRPCMYAECMYVLPPAL